MFVLPASKPRLTSRSPRPPKGEVRSPVPADATVSARDTRGYRQNRASASGSPSSAAMPRLPLMPRPANEIQAPSSRA